jgi:hypothetical protein
VRVCENAIQESSNATGRGYLVPRLCAAVLYPQAVLTMSPLGSGMCAHDVNISIGGGEEILMIAKASEYIEYLVFVGRVEYRC